MQKRHAGPFLTYRFALKKVYKWEIVPRPLRIVLCGRRFTQGETDTPRQSYIIWYNFDISLCVISITKCKGARLLPLSFCVEKVYKRE